MLQNFKTDIIYYNSSTDFELEFNLCGCCRMRLFNDKCSTKKMLLASLSRAVSRSRVIIICAPLFSDDNIFKTVAAAIGSKTEVINNNDYNIASEGEITVIKNSLPLVTEDGIFGGCIIESGPQSLILLTDNATVRKKIMKSLIHPYIKEIAVKEDEPVAELITDGDEPEAEEDTDNAYNGEDLLITDNDEPEAEEDTDNAYNGEDLLLTDEDDYAQEDTSDDDIQSEELFTDIIPVELDSDEDYYYEEDYYTDESDEKASPFNIWMLVISIVLLVALAVLCYCIFYVPTKSGISPSMYLKDVLNTMFK